MTDSVESKLSCFKAYDIRGRVPEELNDETAYRIGRAYCERLSPRRVVVGRDIRLSGEELLASLTRGLLEGGADVLDLGLCGTEEIYFAAFHLESKGVDGGIMVTASHNPMGYNGMKLVQKGARPLSGDTGLNEIERLVREGDFSAVASSGRLEQIDLRPAYVDHLLGYVKTETLKPLRVVVNAGNGCAGPVLDAVERTGRLPYEFITIHHEPDGNFPNGIPNPLLPENRHSTAKAVRKNRADVGIAWDGDFDRCFFFDERGEFVEGYYIVGLLAEQMLLSHPGAKIIHDPRLTWNTVEMVEEAGGTPVVSKTGHAFIKERMRAEDAVYGGEMSAHHYFRDFAYCDSGMIPWLLVLELMSRTGKSLSQLVEERQARYPVSGEINRRLNDPRAAMERVRECYQSEAVGEDQTDGLSLEFTDWRFNLRMSNTEPVIRLNVESRGDAKLMQGKTKELLGLLEGI